MLLGGAALEKLAASQVVVVGTGGVGAAAAEMLVRAGVGAITLIDADSVSESNLNRQLIALNSTLGQMKTDVLQRRLLDINPALQVRIIPEYIDESSIPAVLGGCKADFLVDAIDTLSPKIALIQYCLKNGIPMVSSMGSGAKFDVSAIRIDDISKTHMCPLAHMLRKRLHKLGISTGFKAVYSVEEPRREGTVIEESRNKKSQVGTISYLPTAFGCACAQVAICALTEGLI
ncbi:MAG: tRNA threonylcarbamoyladenosine dehydratase [Bacteroidales bacterium]|nr:tRNA threonylcarbamoyladenosine dehydratase [Candidatus Cryptobacteroides aphodequi]